jgi:hypothetical protein
MKLEPKQINCINEEVCVEIVKLKDKTRDLIISVSLRRTYLMPNPLEINSRNGGQTEESRDTTLLRSFVM